MCTKSPAHAEHAKRDSSEVPRHPHVRYGVVSYTVPGISRIVHPEVRFPEGVTYLTQYPKGGDTYRAVVRNRVRATTRAMDLHTIAASSLR